MLLHYPQKLKIQLFADVEENANKLHFLISSDFVIYPQILIFSVFKIASLSMSLFFYFFFTFASIFGTGNSSQQTSLQYLSIINMVFSDEHNILIKVCILRGIKQRG